MRGALVAGLAIRVGAAATALVWFDEATMGLMGRDVLHGQFPFFFYGQTFIGAIDGYLHAVTFAVLGESVATLRVCAVLVSLVHAAIVSLLAHRVFRAGGWAAVLALVPSAYLLKWASDARLDYSLLLVLVPLCLLLALAAADALRSPASRTRALVVLALVAGLCWWINLLLAPVLMACALALALRRPRSAGRPSSPRSRSSSAALLSGCSRPSTRACPSCRCRSPPRGRLPSTRATSWRTRSRWWRGLRTPS